MNDHQEKANEYITVFSESVIKHGENMFNNPQQANHYYARFTDALHNLAALGNDGLSALATLLDDDRVVVRVTAASYLVHFKTDKALKVLNTAKNEERAIAMLAIVTLKRWETGSYLDPKSGKEVKI